MGKLDVLFVAIVLIFFSIAGYGKSSMCKDAGGVLVLGLGWFECVQEVKHD